MTTFERKTEVLYGADNALQKGVYFMSNVKKKMDIYFDNRAPSIVINVDEYLDGYRDIKRRNGKTGFSLKLQVKYWALQTAYECSR